jgi:hypothetical protein
MTATDEAFHLHLEVLGPAGTPAVYRSFHRTVSQHEHVVSHLVHDVPASGSRSMGDIVSIAVEVAPAAIPSLVMLVQTWMIRNKGAKTRVKVGDIELEVPIDSSPDEAIGLIERLAKLPREECGCQDD